MKTLDADRWLADHGDYLFRVAWRQLHSDELAEDAVQETLLAALSAQARHSGDASPRTWGNTQAEAELSQLRRVLDECADRLKPLLAQVFSLREVAGMETEELASRAMDGRLPLSSRMALRLHLAICENCVRFNRQLQDMRRLFRAETAAGVDAPGLTPGARQRIASELQKKLGS